LEKPQCKRSHERKKKARMKPKENAKKKGAEKGGMVLYINLV
jgi:hypothetical protein